MKTQDLIGLLASTAGPAPRALAARRLAPVLMLGVLASAALCIGGLGFVPASMFDNPALYLKLVYAGGLAAVASWLVARLGRPASATTAPTQALLATFVVMALIGVGSMLRTPDAERFAHLMGSSWLRCPWIIFAVSMPALFGSLWALRGLAPTNYRAAGAAAGVLAGAAGALGYSLHCPEASATFVATWYTLGILLTSLLGALVAPRVLRW